jgi:RNA polymerase sigma factor (TIGR02999 family)
MSDATPILDADGQLVPVVYQELRRLAAHRMSQESPGHTLQPTALVHEAWLRLGGDDAPKFANRAHFFGAAAEAMRRILVESARRKKRVKHGGELERVDVEISLSKSSFIRSLI